METSIPTIRFQVLFNVSFWEGNIFMSLLNVQTYIFMYSLLRVWSILDHVGTTWAHVI